MNPFACIFPGQGAQYLGMGKDFFEHFAITRETFEEAGDILGRNIIDLVFHGSEEELVLTKNSQVAIFVTCYGMYRAICEQFPNFKPKTCAGLSLGEYTALTAGKKISFKECLEIVALRGALMQKAAIDHPGTMAAVLGLDPIDVESALETLGSNRRVWVANLNCPKQVVISGTKEGIEKAAIPLKEKGAKRVLPLDVSGAFHSELMRDAQHGLAPRIEHATFHNSEIDLVMNVPGDYVKDAALMKKFLVEQVVMPVRWEKGVRSMTEHGIQGFIEIGCGKTLSGMNKKMGLTVPTYSIEVLADLENIEQVLSSTLVL